MKRRAEISDDNKSMGAFITLDRETGKTKYTFGKFEDKKQKSPKKTELKEHFVEENLVRYEIVMKNLKSKKWFQASDSQIKKEIATLALDPSTFGYVEDLANRSDTLVEDTILRATKVVHADIKFGIYGIATWFEVEDKDGKMRSEGFYSWGWGPKSGAKLLVLVRRMGKITHFAFQREQKFPTGAVMYNLAGGFPKLNDSVLDFIIRSLKKDLNLDVRNNGVTLNEIVSLGRVSPDSGMTNNHPNLYAVVIDFDDDKYSEVQAGDKFEENVGIVLWPINKISEMVNKCDDSYFLAAMARLTLSGIYDIDLSVKNKKND